MREELVKQRQGINYIADTIVAPRLWEAAQKTIGDITRQLNTTVAEQIKQQVEDKIIKKLAPPSLKDLSKKPRTSLGNILISTLWGNLGQPNTTPIIRLNLTEQVESIFQSGEEAFTERLKSALTSLQQQGGMRGVIQTIVDFLRALGSPEAAAEFRIKQAFRNENWWEETGKEIASKIWREVLNTVGLSAALNYETLNKMANETSTKVIKTIMEVAAKYEPNIRQALGNNQKQQAQTLLQQMINEIKGEILQLLPTNISLGLTTTALYGEKETEGEWEEKVIKRVRGTLARRVRDWARELVSAAYSPSEVSPTPQETRQKRWERPAPTPASSVATIANEIANKVRNATNLRDKLSHLLSSPYAQSLAAAFPQYLQTIAKTASLTQEEQQRLASLAQEINRVSQRATIGNERQMAENLAKILETFITTADSIKPRLPSPQDRAHLQAVINAFKVIKENLAPSPPQRVTKADPWKRAWKIGKPPKQPKKVTTILHWLPRLTESERQHILKYLYRYWLALDKEEKKEALKQLERVARELGIPI